MRVEIATDGVSIYGTCREESHLVVVKGRETLLYVPQHALAVVVVLERRAERQSTDHHRVHDDSTAQPMIMTQGWTGEGTLTLHATT